MLTDVASLLHVRRPSLFFVGAVAASLFEGWAIAAGHSKYMAFPVVALVLIYALQRTIFLLAFAALYLSFAAPASIKVAHLGVVELITFVGLTFVAVRGELELEASGMWVAVLAGASVIGAWIGVGHGTSFHNGFISAREMLVLGVYWLALALFRANQRRTLIVVGCIACVVALASLVQELFPNTVLYVGSSAEVLVSDNGFLRVRLPGDLIYVAEFFAISFLLWGSADRRKRAMISVACVLGAAILVSLNRNWLVGLGLGLLSAWVLGRPNARATFRLLAVAGVAVLVLSAAGGSAIGGRVLSLGNTAALEHGTLADRHYEDAFAERTIRAHPIFGVGWGSYGALVTDQNGVPRPRLYIHNQYFGTWMRAGLLGLVALIVLLWRTFRGGLIAFRRDADWVGAATVAATVGVAASAIVGIYVLQEASAMTLAMLAALSTVLRRPRVQTAAATG